MAADVMHGRWTEGWTRREVVGFWGGILAYGVLLVLGRGTLGNGDPAWQRWLFALGTVAAALFSMSFVVRTVRRTKEVDRAIVTESTALAFGVTMVATVTYGLLETLADLPRLSAWATWMVGMGAWAVTSTLLRRTRL